MGCTNSTIDRPQISQYFRFVAPKKFATKVPWRVAIRTARSITEEVPEARHSSVGAFARLHEANSERDTHRMTNKFKLTLPIPLSKGRVGGQVIDFLKMSSWARFLVDKHLWHQLCGLEAPDEDRCVAIWSEFWKRFQAICPGHEVFQKKTEEQRSRTCALLLHGDEGRSARKAPILVVSTHSALGHGISTADNAKEDRNYTTMKLNYKNPSWTTRYLLGVLPKSMYDEDDGEEMDAFQDFLGCITTDLCELFEKGITDRRGNTFYFSVIFCMGDWPWIAKAGCLTRTFYNAAKRASSKKDPTGVCHQCMADTPGFPWEDWVSQRPAWISSCNTVSPFAREPELLRLALDRGNPASFFTWDLFHTWHIGCGRTFMASAIVTLAMSELFEGSMQARIEAVSKLFEDWCHTNRVRSHMKKITRAKLSWLSSTDFPQGTWSKGATTTTLMKWFVAECQGRANEIQVDGDPLLQVTVTAAQAGHKFLQQLYKQPVWIEAQKAQAIAALGFQFLRSHGEAIRIAYNSRRNLYIQMPNLHRYHHICVEMDRTKPITSAKRRGWNGHRFLCVPHRSWGFNVCNKIRRTCVSRVIVFCVTPIVPESFMMVSSINVLV